MIPNAKEKELSIRLHELLKAKGELPEIREGDWVIHNESGNQFLIKNNSEAEAVNQYRETYILLWSWERCREWLREKGWGLEFLFEENNGEIIKIGFSHIDNIPKEGWGQTDLEAAMAVMVQIAEEKDGE